MNRLKIISNSSQPNLLVMLICLTLLFIFTQITLFLIHYQVSDLVDSMVNTSIALQLMHPIILMPILFFIVVQGLAYTLLLAWIWFVAVSLTELLHLSKAKGYGLGIVIWFIACLSILLLNKHYFPHSFFSKGIISIPVLDKVSDFILIPCLVLLVLATIAAYVNFFWFKRRLYLGSLILLLMLATLASGIYNQQLSLAYSRPLSDQPNIIFIGLDSLRPDFTGFYGNKNVHTPHIDAFLKSSVSFTQSYTPLARTFPSWMSILTAKYPKHNDARNNLVDPHSVHAEVTLAKRLQAAGYETIYATDEKRFSNITKAYGFDRILGPKMGVNDFLLGGLSDFPLTNLLINLPFGKFLFPYNYANRAAAITYQPDKFLDLIQQGLAKPSSKPIFLAVHLCLSHWPFTWASDGQGKGFRLPNQYAASVQGVDKQLNDLLNLLTENGLLKNSLVVLLSDHGTALGLRGDRMITENNYLGDKQHLQKVTKLKLSSAAQPLTTNKNDYTINTAYGQGTNVLSLTQYRILLAFKRFGGELPAKPIHGLVSLLDVAPTILDFLKLPPLNKIDGISLWDNISQTNKPLTSRAFFMETGDSISEIETDHIYVEKVIKHQIGIYKIDIKNGLLMMDTVAEQGLIKNKQLAVLKADWLLAHFPARLEKKLIRKNPDQKVKSILITKSSIVPPYFVLANLKTQKWTIGLKSALAKSAPTADLFAELKRFYGDELIEKPINSKVKS